MSMGIGKRYLVQRIDSLEGASLEDCIDFMKKNKPKDDNQFFELWPRVDVKNKTCSKYTIALVKVV